MSTPKKINFKTATTRYENSETTTKIVSKRRIWWHRVYFFLKNSLHVENFNSRGKRRQKIDTMPQFAPRRDVFGRGLGIFVARRGGFKLILN